MDCKEIYNDMRSKGIEKDQFKCLVNISIKMDQYVIKKKYQISEWKQEMAFPKWQMRQRKFSVLKT